MMTTDWMYGDGYSLGTASTTCGESGEPSVKQPIGFVQTSADPKKPPRAARRKVWTTKHVSR